MALYIKFRTRETPNNSLIRCESAIKFFTCLNKKLNVKNAELRLFDYEPIDSLNSNNKFQEFDFGIYNSYVLKKLKQQSYEAHEIKGLEIKGIIKKNNKEFTINYILNPLQLSRRYYDLRIDVLPNAYVDDFEDLENFIPELREIIFDRIKEYNVEQEKNYIISTAIMSDYGDELGTINKWSFLYSKDVDFLIKQILTNSDKLKEYLEFTDQRKFANELMNNHNFIASLDAYAQQNKIAVQSGSICIQPKSKKNMNDFVEKISDDIDKLAIKIFRPKDFIKNEIDNFFSS